MQILDLHLTATGTVVVDEKGEILSGDELLAICADKMRREKTLRNDTAVSTVMSNFGLGVALRKMGIRHLLTDVGDRHVMEAMKAAGQALTAE